MAKNADPLKAELARISIKIALPYVEGWLKTLGDAGGKGKNVAAAKAGLDFINKFVGEAGEATAGQGLLESLAELETVAGEIGSAEDGEPTGDAG